MLWPGRKHKRAGGRKLRAMYSDSDKKRLAKLLRMEYNKHKALEGLKKGLREDKMNVKAVKFNDYLATNKITWFTSQEIDNEMHAVLFRSFMEVSGQNLPAMVVLDDSIYMMVQVRVAAGVVRDSNRNGILEHINALNRKYKVFKYYVSDNQDIIIESCIPATNENFVPDIIHVVIDIILKHLAEEYPQIMKLVWAN